MFVVATLNSTVQASVHVPASIITKLNLIVVVVVAVRVLLLLLLVVALLLFVLVVCCCHRYYPYMKTGLAQFSTKEKSQN